MVYLWIRKEYHRADAAHSATFHRQILQGTKQTESTKTTKLTLAIYRIGRQA